MAVDQRRHRTYDERVQHAPTEQHDAFFDLPVDRLTESEQRDRPVPDSDHDGR